MGGPWRGKKEQGRESEDVGSHGVLRNTGRSSSAVIVLPLEGREPVESQKGEERERSSVLLPRPF